jgi:hypothetical protein
MRPRSAGRPCTRKLRSSAGTAPRQPWHGGWQRVRGANQHRAADANRSGSARWAFKQVPRELGLARGDAFDEFDAVRLCRQRHTPDWVKVSAASRRSPSSAPAGRQANPIWIPSRSSGSCMQLPRVFTYGPSQCGASTGRRVRRRVRMTRAAHLRRAVCGTRTVKGPWPAPLRDGDGRWRSRGG